MSELYKIIGLREFDENLMKEFENYLEKDSIEAQQIKHGYTNPLIFANIIKCRSKCLTEE